MHSPRLNRLFRADERCVILAFDHGLFGEPTWMAGLKDIEKIIREHALEEPDGMTLPPGSARCLQSVVGRHKPVLLLRADITNAYLGSRPRRMFAQSLTGLVQRALMLDAACVVAALLTYPDQAELTQACLVNLDSLRADCDSAGMPLMIEILRMTDNDGVPLVASTADEIAPLVRQAMELGADVIKAVPTAPVGEFTRIVNAAAMIPVLASGGIKASDAEVLARTADLMQAGASGIAYGRNVMWAERPALMTRALLKIVHDGVSAAEAAACAEI